MSDAQKKSERLYSLDLLRGLDMFLLTVIGPFFAALNAASRLPDGVMGQFRHNWGGFTLWDIIMPLFIFMCGAAVPFALPKRMEGGRAGWCYWRHVASRVALLWVLGMVAQGRLLSCDIMSINPFNNTLQAIAAGYLVAAIVLAIRSRAVRLSAPFVLAVAYTLFLHFCGDYTMDGNAATKVERWMLALITPAGSKAVELADPGYSWWATIPMFGAMTLCGMSATNMLLSSESPLMRFAKLLGLGVALLAAGLLLAPVVPPIKHIFTVTFTAQAMGVCCILLALLYGFADILRLRRGCGLFVLFGQTSLAAYMCHEFKPVLRAFGKFFEPGAVHLFGEKAGPIAVWLGASALLVFALYVWRAKSSAKASSGGPGKRSAGY